MPEPIPILVEQLTHRYIDDTRFTSSGDVLLFAMRLFGEFEARYHDELGKSLQAAFRSIEAGEGIPLAGQKDIEAFFDDMMETARKSVDPSAGTQ